MIPPQITDEYENLAQSAQSSGRWDWVTGKLLEISQAQDEELHDLRQRVEMLEAAES